MMSLLRCPKKNHLIKIQLCLLSVWYSDYVNKLPICYAMKLTKEKKKQRKKLSVCTHKGCKRVDCNPPFKHYQWETVKESEDNNFF